MANDPVTVEVHGHRELQREIARMKSKELRKEMRDAGKDAGEPAKKDARAFLARNHSRSGRLERSVGVQASGKTVYLKIGTNGMEYQGPFIGGWRARGMRPHPVITVAAAKTKKERRRAYEASMDRLTRKVRQARR